jgi:uncharacterized protein YecT (DUF1311 family)
MAIQCIVLLAIILPSLAFASHPCEETSNTIEINHCVQAKIESAEKILARYYEESKRRYAESPKVLSALSKSQKIWLQFRKSHCEAIYEMWSEGTIRGAMYGNCLLEQTQRRTHDLWESYLTFMDSTPPVLPEPTW